MEARAPREGHGRERIGRLQLQIADQGPMTGAGFGHFFAEALRARGGAGWMQRSANVAGLGSDGVYAEQHGEGMGRRAWGGHGKNSMGRPRERTRWQVASADCRRWLKPLLLVSITGLGPVGWMQDSMGSHGLQRGCRWGVGCRVVAAAPVSRPGQAVCAGCTLPLPSHTRPHLCCYAGTPLWRSWRRGSMAWPGRAPTGQGGGTEGV